MFRLRRYVGRVYALISFYLLLSLPVAFAYEVENFRCEEYGVSGVLARASIVEYCTGPSSVLEGTEGKKMFFLYASLGSKTEIVLDYDVDGGSGSCDSYVSLQKEGGMQLDSDKITISGAGTFALICDGSFLSVRPTDDTSVLPQGDCDALIKDRFDVEVGIDYLAHLTENKPIDADLDEIESSINYLRLIISAFAGATAGFAVMCDISGTPGSGDVPPEAGVCQTCGGKVEYPSFRIVTPTPEEVEAYDLGYNRDTSAWRFLIETKMGEFAGEKYILTEVVDSTLPDELSVRCELSSLQRFQVGSVASSVKDGKAVIISAILLDKSYQGRGLMKVLNDALISRFLVLGVETIEAHLPCDMCNVVYGREQKANPFSAKSLKNMRFEPKIDMEALLQSASFRDTPVMEGDIFKTMYKAPVTGEYYYCVELQFRDDPLSHYMFLEDDSGRFIEGRQYYVDHLVDKTAEEVRSFLLGREQAGRTLWGKGPYEAKDIPYLKTNILDNTIVEPCVCSSPSDTKKAYYPAGGGDVTIFKKFPELDTAVIVDTGGDILELEAKVYGSASINRMHISDVHVTGVGSGKWEITFDYEGRGKTIIYYSRDANTFFPAELRSGYDVYYERLFRGTHESQVLYDMTPETKFDVIKNLRVGSYYTVFSRWDYMTHKHELAPSLLGLEEVSRTEYSDGWLGHVCKKVKEIPDDLLLKILEKIYPHAEEAYRARTGRATTSPSVDDNVNIFEGALEAIRGKLGEFTDEEKKFIADSLETDIIKNGPLLKEMGGLPPGEANRLLLKTVNKFCEFQRRIAVPGVTPICTGGGCYRAAEPLTRESLDVVIDGELRGNLITVTEDIVNNILGELKAEDPNFKGEFVIVYGGSSNYGYTMDGEKASINFDAVVKDLDYFVIFSEDLPQNKRGEIMNMVTSRLFDLKDTLFAGRDITSHNIGPGGTFREIVEGVGAKNRILMTKNIFIGPSAILADIQEQFGELKITPEVMGTGLGAIIDGSLGAEYYAGQGDYGKACKRLAQTANLMNDKELTSDIITEYINHPADMKGTYDHYLPLIRDKITEFVSLLDVQHKIKAINRCVEYYRRINKEIIWELEKQYTLEKVDVPLIVGLDDKLKDMLRELNADDILITPEDKAPVRSIIEATRDYIRELRMAPEIIDYMGLPAEEVAENRIKHFIELVEELNRISYDDYVGVLSEGKEIATKYKGLVDAGEVEPTQEIKEAADRWVKAIEKNIAIADKLDRWHDSEYSKYGRKVRGDEIKQLRDIGRSKYAEYGAIAGLVLSVLLTEGGNRLMVAGYESKDPYLSKIGYWMARTAHVATIVFLVMFFLAILMAIADMSIAALIDIAVGAVVCYSTIELLMLTVDYLVCEMGWSKEVGIGTYNLYKLLCTYPAIHVKLNDASGSTICDYTDRWSGQREVACP